MQSTQVHHGMGRSSFAGLFEIGWAVGLKYTEGFSRFWPSLATIAAMVVSLFLLGVALKTLPVGTAYAVWTGIGTIRTAARHRPLRRVRRRRPSLSPDSSSQALWG